jgi:hypothetical protein
METECSVIYHFRTSSRVAEKAYNKAMDLEGYKELAISDKIVVSVYQVPPQIVLQLIGLQC